MGPLEVDSSIAYWVRALANCVSRDLGLRLAQKGVTVAEWTMLGMLYRREPVAPSRLAEQMGMSRGAITKLADRLIAKSLLVRTATEAEGYAQTLALTRKGTNIVPELAALAEETDKEFFEALHYKDRFDLEHSLKFLVQEDRRLLKEGRR